MTERTDDPIVITGIGAITPIGTGAANLWAGAMAEKSAVRTITRFDPSPFSSHIAAEVADFDPGDYLDAKQVRRFDRYSQFAVACAQMAFADAGLLPESLPSDRVGACIGTALGGVAMAEAEHAKYLAGGVKAVSPLLALSIFAGAASCNVAIEFGFTGPTSANGDSCASAPIAIANAIRYLNSGEADVMIAGGAEAPLSALSFGAFALIRALSVRNDDPQTASRPFDAERDGFVMGEGAAVFVLEKLSHAVRRDAGQVYGAVTGFAVTNDGTHMTAPRPDAACAIRAMRRTLERAGRTPDEIVAISAHGSSTPLNDSTETRAIKAALGEDKARRTPIFATKAMHGHALGATGAFEAALTCLALKNGRLPRTINRENPDPECDLDYITEESRGFAVGPILSNSFGFGGINACLCIEPLRGDTLGR